MCLIKDFSINKKGKDLDQSEKTAPLLRKNIKK